MSMNELNTAIRAGEVAANGYSLGKGVKQPESKTSGTSVQFL